MFVCPDGLTPAQFRTHPVRQLISHAANFGRRAMPTKGELDALKLSPELRGQVETACLEAAEIHDDGEHATAWKTADLRAAEILTDLPERQRDPGFYRAPDPAADLTDPSELAALVPNFLG